MGNSQLQMDQAVHEGQIFIEMPSMSCVGGTFTSGTVHIKMDKMFHTDAVYLRFKGYERSHPGTSMK